MKDLLDKYIQYKKYLNHTPDTLRTDYDRIKYYLPFPVEQWPFVFYGKSSKRKGITTLKELITMKVFFKWCVHFGHLKEDLFKDIPKPKVEKPIPKALNKKEVADVLNAATNIGVRERAIYYTFLYTGLRKSELLNLEKSRVDFSTMTIFVKNGKGRKDRSIPMKPELAFVLMDWKLHIMESHLMFPIHECTLRRIKRKVEAKSGVKHSIHQLRHTFATIAVRSQCSIYALSRILGHTTVKTTEIYLSADDDQMRTEIDKLSFF